jgi:hypothetical protein
LTVDGHDYPIVDRPAGSADTAAAAPGGFLISGWAVDYARKGSARKVVAVAGNRVIGSVVPSFDRPELAALLQAKHLRTGFRLFVPRGELSTEQRLHLFVITEDGAAAPLAGSLSAATGGLTEDVPFVWGSN